MCISALQVANIPCSPLSPLAPSMAHSAPRSRGRDQQQRHGALDEEAQPGEAHQGLHGDRAQGLKRLGGKEGEVLGEG